MHILKEKQFSGLDLNSFRQRRSELTEQLKSTLESPVAVKAAALTEKLNNAREREYASKLSGKLQSLTRKFLHLKTHIPPLKQSF